MWTINGAMALWLGYWLFMGWVVWTYERKVREQKVEIEKLKRLVGGSGGRLGKRLSGELYSEKLPAWDVGKTPAKNGGKV